MNDNFVIKFAHYVCVCEYFYNVVIKYVLPIIFAGNMNYL